MMAERKYHNYLHLSNHLGLRRLAGKSETATITLFFFPFVGGQSLSFKGVASALPENWVIWGVDPPGHGWSQGTFLTDFEEMVALYFAELSYLWKDNFFLYGHSLGGLVIYRLAQLMEAKGIRPGAIFISAAPLPHRISEYEYLRYQSREQLLATMNAHGGGMTNIHEQFLEPYLASIRADIGVFLSCRIERRPIATPMTVLYSKNDSFLDYEYIYEWDIYGNNVDFEEMAGNHIYIQSHSALVASCLKSRISRS